MDHAEARKKLWFNCFGSSFEIGLGLIRLDTIRFTNGLAIMFIFMSHI